MIASTYIHSSDISFRQLVSKNIYYFYIIVYLNIIDILTVGHFLIDYLTYFAKGK